MSSRGKIDIHHLRRTLRLRPRRLCAQEGEPERRKKEAERGIARAAKDWGLSGRIVRQDDLFLPINVLSFHRTLEMISSSTWGMRTAARWPRLPNFLDFYAGRGWPLVSKPSGNSSKPTTKAKAVRAIGVPRV